MTRLSALAGRPRAGKPRLWSGDFPVFSLAAQRPRRRTPLALLAVASTALLVAATAGAASIPWEWDDARTVRAAASSASSALASFRSKGPAPVMVGGLASFESRIRSKCDYVLARFSNAPIGAVIVIR